MKTTLQIIEDRADILESSDGLDRAIALHYAMLMKVYATNPSYFKTLFKSNCSGQQKLATALEFFQNKSF